MSGPTSDPPPRNESAPSPSPRAPWSERACDLFLVGFAAWTLACHAVVLAGGGLVVLLPVAAVVLALLSWLWRRSGAAGRVPPPAAASGPSRTLPWMAGGLVAGLAVAGTWLGTGQVVLTWWVAVVASLAAYALAARGAADDDAGAAPRALWRELALLGLALLGALATELVQRPDIDDCYYVNVSAAIADAPRAALLAHDTLYGVADLPLMLSVYKLHSFEVLAGALAWLTPLSAIQAAHLVVPPLFGLFIALAIARLARRLAPATWLEVTLVTLVLLGLTAETHRWWGNFAFARQHQGKGVFVTTLVPLLIAAGLDFARRPSRRGFLRLVLAQVAAVGATATALWAGPVAAGLGLVAGSRLAPRALARTSLGLLASAYPVGLGLALRASTAKVVSQLPLPGEAPVARGDDAGLVRSAWELSLGKGPLALACLVAVAAAWGFARTGAARRALAALSVVFLVVLSDPYTAQLVADGVTSDMTYFRVFWVLPVPLLLALVLTAPARWRPGPLGHGLALAAAVLFLVFVPRVYTLSPENQARLEPFALKVHEEEYRVARELVGHVPPRSHVAAALFPSVYVGTFPAHPYCVTSRLDYLRFLEPHVSRVDLARREAVGMALYQPGWTANAARAAAFEDALRRFDVRGVICLAVDTSLPPLLRRLGFQSIGGTRNYRVWVREDAG